MVWLTAAVICPRDVTAGQTPRKKPPAPPFAVLFPLEPAWAITLPAAPVRPAVRDGERWLVPLSSGALVAVSWEDGGTVWSVPLRATTAPVVGDGVVYVGGGDTLYALDPATGAGHWTSHAGGTLLALALAGSRVLGVGAGFAHAFDAGSGRELWARTLPAAGDPTGLAVSATALFVAYADGRIVALALADGGEQWARPIDGRPSAPLLLGNALFVGTTERRFYSLDAGSGKERWAWRTGGDVTGAAADAKAVYYTSLDAVVRAVNPGNGHQRWKRDAGTRAPVPPIALDGSVLVTGLSPTISAFAPQTGTPLGTLELPGEVSGAPLVSPTLTPRQVAVVVVLKDGRVYGLRALTLQFNEAAPQPLAALPGQTLAREKLPERPVIEPSEISR